MTKTTSQDERTKQFIVYAIIGDRQGEITVEADNEEHAIAVARSLLPRQLRLKRAAFRSEKAGSFTSDDAEICLQSADLARLLGVLPAWADPLRLKPPP